jgi:hypothetical protein
LRGGAFKRRRHSAFALFFFADSPRSQHVDRQRDKAESTDGEQHKKTDLSASHGEFPSSWRKTGTSNSPNLARKKAAIRRLYGRVDDRYAVLINL